jgi:ribosomal protein S18 acetylase RimI-like enzyme
MSTLFTNFEFILASAQTEFTAAKELFLEYANSLDFNLCFQDFESELRDLEVMYNRQDGGIILIKEISSGEFVGCAGIRKIKNEVAELKRMYIKPAYRHQGLGEQLLDKAVSLAEELGYKKIRLDTMPSMKSAINIYRAKGFKEIEPYRFNPNNEAFFFELRL